VTFAFSLGNAVQGFTYVLHSLFLHNRADGLVQSRHAHLSGVQSLKNYEEEKFVIRCALRVMDPKADAPSFLLGLE
jgi:hypothetical protein